MRKGQWDDEAENWKSELLKDLYPAGWGPVWLGAYYGLVVRVCPRAQGTEPLSGEEGKRLYSWVQGL